MVKNPPAKTGDIRDAGSTPGLGRSPGGGFDNLLEYSCLENPMDRVVWQSKVHRVAKSQTGSDLALVYIEELEKDMASLSCVLAWRIPWREDPGWLQSTGLQRVRHNLATKQSRGITPAN